MPDKKGGRHMLAIVPSLSSSAVRRNQTLERVHSSPTQRGLSGRSQSTHGFRNLARPSENSRQARHVAGLVGLGTPTRADNISLS